MRFAPAFAPPAPATGAKPDTASAEISTDVSHLPDLTAYLDDLLRTRERLAAAIDGADEWARADATPAEEEITRIRRAHRPDQQRHRPAHRRRARPDRPGRHRDPQPPRRLPRHAVRPPHRALTRKRVPA